MANSVAMLATGSNRSKLYLRALSDAAILPSAVVLMTAPDEQTPEEKAIACSGQAQSDGDWLAQPFTMLLEQLDVPYKLVPSLNPNSEEVIAAVAELADEVVIYSGPGGAILRRKLLATGKRFLHVHSGILPDYRGSTTLYYSLLDKDECGATAFIIDQNIDTGPIIRAKRFPPPADRTTIDLHYDPMIRAELLAEVVAEYVRTGKFSCEPQVPQEGETYFIVHPVLKHIAILAK